MNIFDLDYITSVLMDVATMVGTIVGVVGLTAVFVVAALRIADARAVEAARDAVSAARKAKLAADEATPDVMPEADTP